MLVTDNITWLERDIVEAARERAASALIFSANATLRSSGALVMGRGAAQAVRDAYEGSDAALGREIDPKGQWAGSVAPDYHLAIVRVAEWRMAVAALQVKRHWQGAGDAALTEMSLARLVKAVRSSNARGPFVLNMPLVGEGGWRGREGEIVDMLLRHLHIPSEAEAPAFVVCHLGLEVPIRSALRLRDFTL